MRLQPGQVALITGGGTGIGRGIALALARRGVNLALVGRRAAPLQQVAAEAMALGPQVLILPADMCNATARDTVVACTRDAFGRIDLLINNAGLLTGGSLANQSAEKIEVTVATNLTAAMDLTRLALPDLTGARGTVVLVGSTMSIVPMPYATLYSATKAGLSAFGSALRFELAPLGVHVLTVYPPATRTPMLEGRAAAAGFGRFAQDEPDVVGERIIRDVELSRSTDLWGAGERLLALLQRCAPGLTTWVLGTQRRHFLRALEGTVHHV